MFTLNHCILLLMSLFLLGLALHHVALVPEPVPEHWNPPPVNNRPILGVLLQEQKSNKTQYVASSYVKFIEAAGARVVPIFLKRPRSYYIALLSQINGVLLPGGGTPLLDTGYSQAADLIFELAASKHDAPTSPIYFPIFAICLSFEKMLTYFSGNTLHWQTAHSVQNVALNLDLQPLDVLNSSRLLGNANKQILDILRFQNVTANYHRICLTLETFNKCKNLTENFRLLSTNTYNSLTFVSTLEHRVYPFYGLQWHPEKNQFEWVLSERLGNIAHNAEAITVGQYFANFLVNEARKNTQRFANQSEEAEALIYNFSDKLKYSGKRGRSAFAEIYVWPI